MVVPGLSAAGDPQVTTLRILVVDDNRDAAELLDETLRAMGHAAHLAFDGHSALQAAEAFQPNVALIDIGLPVMNGYQLADQLRGLNCCANVRLIAVTGYGHDSDKERSRDAGFHAHLVKPIDFNDLKLLLQQLVAQGA